MGADPVREALTSDHVQRLIRVKARQLRRRPEFRRAEPLEIQQDLALHVVRSAHLFDASRSAVTTFIDRVVDSAAAMLCRERSRLKRGPGVCVQSLEGSALQANGKAASLLDVLTTCDSRRHRGVVPDDERQSELAADLPRALAGLTPLHRAIALRLMNATQGAIARDLGVSRRQVDAAVAAIRKHLQKAGFTGI